MTDAASQPDEFDGPEPTELDILLETLSMFGVQYTLIRDEAGSTIECAGGDRGMHGFAGLAITFNFGPHNEDMKLNEQFLFIGVVRI